MQQADISARLSCYLWKTNLNETTERCIFLQYRVIYVGFLFDKLVFICIPVDSGTFHVANWIEVKLHEMENDGAGALEFPYHCSVKVHRLICLELTKLLERIAQIFSAVESARPRCTSGIPALCSLQVSMEKAKSIIQYCSQSSKLYLAITGEKILSRCEQLRDTLDSCLSQIQNMVPLLLAAKISGIIHDLRNANFLLDSADKEAGKILLALIRQDITATSIENNKELEALQLAALKLGITSPVAVLIEKRTIKKLLDDVNDTASRKKKILMYLFYLLRKYGNLIWQCQSKSTQEGLHREFLDDYGSPEPPDVFKCPMSVRLMYDPVIIDSGRTFERIWIQRWFNEGNETCPITHKKLESLSLTPNLAMKSLIAKWCLKHEITISDPCLHSFPASLSRSRTSCSSSVASLGSYMDDLRLQVSSVSICSSNTRGGSDLSENNDVECKNGLVQINTESQNPQSSADSHDKKLGVLKLAELSWESQCKAVEDMKNQLEDRDQVNLLGSSYNYVNSLIKFMKDASNLSDVRAQREGAEVLLAILSKNRNEMPPFQDDAIYVLTSHLDSEITGTALAILEILSCEQHCMSKMLASGVLPSILKVLETQIRQFDTLALKILRNLSINSNIGYHMVYLDYIPKLVPFLDDGVLARYSIEIMNNLCSIEEARIAIVENSECVAAIGKLLEGTDDQEHALDVLLSLCHCGAEYCQLVMTESIVQSLVYISVNGNSRVRLIAIELLQLLGYNTCNNNASKYSIPSTHFDLDNSCLSKGKKPSSKAVSFLGREVSVFSKRR